MNTCKHTVSDITAVSVQSVHTKIPTAEAIVVNAPASPPAQC